MGKAWPNKVSDPKGTGTHVKGSFFGFEIDALADDLFPVKNHLPPELGVLFKTERQWEEAGFSVPEDSLGYEMHPTMLSCKTCTYYHEDDVDGDKEDRRYIAFKSRTVRDLKKAAGGGGLRALLERRKREADEDPALIAKNELPEEERLAWRTAGQWIELGYEPDPLSEGTFMRPSRGRRPCLYFRKEDVVPLANGSERNCWRCGIRGEDRMCPVAGEKVTRFGCCSEWEPRDV